MRISDWSSDVCSSDLLRRLVLDCVGLEIRHGLGSGCVPPILAQSAHARCYGARRSTITAVHTSCGTRNGLLRTEEKALRPQHGGPPGANALGRDAHCVGLRPTRSEEHTSELPSLMRISYAVFCLKKKTTPH